MRHSFLRLFSAFLLMGIALAVCIGLMAKATGEKVQSREEASGFWLRLSYALPREGSGLRVFTAEGQVFFTLERAEGERYTGPLLPPGRYFAVTEQSCTAFSVSAEGGVTVEQGCGYYDGEEKTLHLRPASWGTLCLLGQSTQVQEERDYQLVGQDGAYRQPLQWQQEQGLYSCCFRRLPYGTYVLKEGGRTLCAVELSEERSHITLSLP